MHARPALYLTFPALEVLLYQENKKNVIYGPERSLRALGEANLQVGESLTVI